MRKVHIAIIISLTILIGAGVGILIWVLRANRSFVQDVELKSNGTTTQMLSYTAENILPGQQREYDLFVHCAEDGDFSLTFSGERTGEGELWKYLDLEIVCGEETKSAPLSALLEENSTLHFEIALEQDVPMHFIIRYVMPLNIESEAMGERADFILLLTAKRA